MSFYRRLLLAFLMVGLLAVWQVSLARDQKSIFRQHLPSVSALNLPRHHFLYFYYHTNLFPVSTTLTGLKDDPAEARRVLQEHGNTLRMEPIEGFLWGDFAQVLLYFPKAWWTGSTRNPDVRFFHGLMFISALALLLLAFMRSRKTIFGIILVLLLGSSNFQLFQVYKSENVWGWPITTNLAMLALFLPLLLGRKIHRSYLIAMSLLAGICLGTLSHIRPEILGTALSIFLAYLVLARRSGRMAVIGLLIFMTSLIFVRQAWKTYFIGKIQEARTVVSKLGGQPYLGPTHPFHVVWHAVYCGLGDFGQKYGYVWDDRVAEAYAAPYLLEKTGIKIEQKSTKGWTPFTYVHSSGEKNYDVRAEFIPGYSEILRDKILGDIKRDPVWFAGVMARRLVRVASMTPPLEFRAGGWRMEWTIWGWIVVAMAIVVALLLRMSWFLPILLFMVAPSLPALVMYSGGGATSYSIFHFPAAALLFWSGWRALTQLACRYIFQSRRRASASGTSHRRKC